MALCANLAAGLAYDCDNKPKSGIEQSFVLVNLEDIDLSASTIDVTSTTHKITNLQLLSGKTGYEMVGIGDKRLFSAGFTFQRNEEFPNDFIHTINARLWNTYEASLAWLKQLGEGANVVAIVEKRDKGTASIDAYEVYGWYQGLKLTEAVNAINDNQGTTPLVLASAGDFEPYPPLKLVMTDYATTKAAYDTQFLQA